MNTPDKKLSLGAGKSINPGAGKKLPSMDDIQLPELTATAKPPATAKKPATQKANPEGPEPLAEILTRVNDIPVWDHTRQDRDGEKPSSAETITLAGTTKSGYPFEELSEGQAVYLIPDPYGMTVKPNEGHGDPTAISVQDKPENGRHIAYIPKAMASIITKGLNAGYKYEADVLAIKGGYVGGNGEMLNWGVDLATRFYRPHRKLE